MEIKEQLSAALVIEQQPLAQSHIKYALHSIGFKQVEFADRAQIALNALSNHQYDLVICAFDLSRGADGYQLFEHIVERELLPGSTTFVFMSSENNMPLSRSIIELKPDDFMLKPFTTKEIELRLKRILQKKLTLKDVFKAIDKKKYKDAIESLNSHISNNSHPRWVPYLLKLKGEVITTMENWPLAEKFFDKVCNVSEYPWAKLGLIESLLHQGKLEKAKSLLKEMLQSPQNKVQALDLMAEICQQSSEFDEALEHIQQASKLAPRNINRLKQVVNLARLTHDFELQHSTSISIVRHLKHSVHDCPESYLSAVRAAIDYGLTTINQDEINQLANNSENILSNMKRQFPGIPLGEQIQIAQARIFNMKNEPEKARRLLNENIDDKNIYYIDDLEDALDKAKAFHELGFHADSQKLFQQIAHACEDKNNNVIFKEYIKNEQALRIEIKQSPKQLNNQAVGYFSRGNFQGAYDAFTAAFKLMPKNPSIALNLMQSILEHQYLDPHQIEVRQQLQKCSKTLTNAELNEEQLARYTRLQHMLDEQRIAV